MKSDPPITELVLHLGYDQLTDFSLLDLADLYQRHFHSEYPNFQQVSRLAPLQISPASPPPPLTPFMIDGPPRLWFISRDLHDLVQFQDDRLVQNWRRLGPLEVGQEYPGYLALRKRYETSFRKLAAWLAERGLAMPQARQAELTYVNMVPTRVGDKERALADILAFIRPTGKPYRSLGWNLSWWESQPDIEDAFILVQIMGAGLPDGSPALQINLSARCSDPGMDLERALARFDLMHDNIHSIFDRIFTSEIVESARL